MFLSEISFHHPYMNTNKKNHLLQITPIFQIQIGPFLLSSHRISGVISFFFWYDVSVIHVLFSDDLHLH